MRQEIADASEALVGLVREDTRSVVVPSCPEWTLEDLAWHVGVVQHFWAVNVREGNPSSPRETIDDELASDLDTFTAWCRNATRELLDALEEVGDEWPCWVWWGEPALAGAVARHQVQEAAIHAWDGANALGLATPLAPAVAADGVGEFLHVHHNAIAVPAGAGVSLHATDLDLVWRVGAEESVRVSASASTLVLFLNGRVPLEALEVVGNAQLVRAALGAVDLS
jgi:uncharacterized protein (TIGR03083 family)